LTLDVAADAAPLNIRLVAHDITVDQTGELRMHFAGLADT
jgi:hypothetical protein